ncbi:DUF4402 domain-containing protein [Flavobacterium sp. PL12]|uniref:DUF4402 domain-containing protein n=1 Tax=Flavobacterium sp. PL12 TaxID=3071718 RepID=UPI00319DCA82
MKKITLLAILIIAALSSNANAQTVVSPVATATATIITPLTISKLVDMNFGDISTNGTNGTVILSNANVRSATGGASFSAATPGTITSAKFVVTGNTGYAYSISIPTAITLTHTNTTSVMQVTNIGNSVGATGTLTGGTQDISVGGTLNLVGAQLEGVYTNTTDLKVTVNYN